MNVKQTISLLAILAFFVVVLTSDREEKNSIMNRDQGASVKRLQASSVADAVEHSPFPEKLFESSGAASSSTPRRELRRNVALNFKQCFDTCTNSSAPMTTIEDNCCVGGVGFLKLQFHAPEPIDGTISLGSAETCAASQNRHKVTKAGGPSKTPSTNTELRIVDCNDICVQKPFGGHPCSVGSVVNEQHVVPGSEICIAMVRPTETMYEYEIAFDQKMDHNLHILFLSNDGFSVGVIHTSCSKPLTNSWGVVFGECDHSTASGKKKYEHVDIGYFMNVSFPYLSFVDGISTEYFGTAMEALSSTDTTKYANAIDIGFNDCGCACEPNNITIPEVDLSTEPSESPSLVPSTEDPTFSPTWNPSSAPTSASTSTTTSTSTFSSTYSDTSDFNPGPGPSFPTFAPTCSSECSAFVFQHCVFAGTNYPCHVNAQAPIFPEDDDGAGATAGPPSISDPKSVYGAETYYSHGKQGKKGTKSASLGKGSERSRKKYSIRNKSTKSKGKGSEGRRLVSDANYLCHLHKQSVLKEIEYYQSQLDYNQERLYHDQDRMLQLAASNPHLVSDSKYQDLLKEIEDLQSELDSTQDLLDEKKDELLQIEC